MHVNKLLVVLFGYERHDPVGRRAIFAAQRQQNRFENGHAIVALILRHREDEFFATDAVIYFCGEVGLFE